MSRDYPFHFKQPHKPTLLAEILSFLPNAIHDPFYETCNHIDVEWEQKLTSLSLFSFFYHLHGFFCLDIVSAFYPLRVLQGFLKTGKEHDVGANLASHSIVVKYS